MVKRFEPEIKHGMPCMAVYPEGRYVNYDDVPKWISVEDRPMEFPCYTYWDDGTQDAYSKEEVERCGLTMADFLDDEQEIGAKVTHWMPLPEPPKLPQVE